MIFPRSVIGLALTEERVSVVSLVRGRVTHAFTLEQGEQLASLFHAEMEARKVKTRYARVSLPRSWAVVKEIDLPPAVGEDLSQMVAFELERHLPYPIEEALYDFRLRPTAKHLPKRIIVVAVERRTIDQVLKLADELGLRLLSIDLAPHALLSLVKPPAKDSHVGLVHVAEEKADLLFLEGPRLRLSRSIALNGVVDQITAEEIRRSLGLLRWNSLDALWLSGDEAEGLLSSPSLSAFGADPSLPPYSPRALKALPLLDGNSPGLALPALASAWGRRPQSNLLPPERRPRRPHWSHVATAISLLVTIALGVGVLVIQGWQERRSLSRLNQAINALEPQVKTVEQLSLELGRHRKLVASFKDLERAGFQPLPVLKELTELIPQDAWLSNVSMDAKGVELTGQATQASLLIPLLENSPLLERVEFASPVTRGRDKEQFRIRAGWERPAGAPPPLQKSGQKSGR